MIKHKLYINDAFFFLVCCCCCFFFKKNVCVNIDDSCLSSLKSTKSTVDLCLANEPWNITGHSHMTVRRPLWWGQYRLPSIVGLITTNFNVRSPLSLCLNCCNDLTRCVVVINWTIYINWSVSCLQKPLFKMLFWDVIMKATIFPCTIICTVLR